MRCVNSMCVSSDSGLAHHLHLLVHDLVWGAAVARSHQAEHCFMQSELTAKTLCPERQLMNYQEASAFFKKRAAIEDDYGRTLQKIARSTSETYAMNDGKAGCVRSRLRWHPSLTYHF